MQRGFTIVLSRNEPYMGHEFKEFNGIADKWFQHLFIYLIISFRSRVISGGTITYLIEG